MADQLDLRPQINTPDYSGLVNSYKSPLSSFNQIPQQFAQLIAAKQAQQKKQIQQQMINEWLKKQSQPTIAPTTMNVGGHQNAPIASFDPMSGQATPQMTETPNPNAAFASLQGLPPEVIQQVIGPMLQSSLKARGIAGGKPSGSYWLDPNDPQNISITPKPGWKEIKTSAADAGSKVYGAAAGKAKNAALMGRANAWERLIDNKQIDLLAKSIGITPKQQSLLQNNNMRADRALEILASPTITWQELALGEIDLAGIMQGGVPQVDEVKNTHFPGWQQQWSSWKTYATGHPDESVPPDIQEKVKNLVSGVVQIDNKFLQANAKFHQKMLAPTIRGGIDQFKPAINEMTNVLTTQPSGQDSGGWSIQR